jgi:N-acetylmuramoyl-L-alanine amidase
MIKIRIMKRRLLRGVVRDNLDVAKGIPPQRHRLPPAPGLSLLSLVTITAAVVALAPLFFFTASRQASQLQEVVSLAQTADPTPQAIALNTAPPVTQEPIDPVPPFSPVTRQPDGEEPGAVDHKAAPNAEVEASEPSGLDARLSSFKAFALGVKKIVIDPGHGGDDPGVVIAHGLNEKTITLDIGLRLRALLLGAAFEVRMTREQDETRSLVKRATFANEEGGDLFISIHLNWLAPRWARVVETFYLGTSEDQAVLQLAGAENRHSGYSMADFRRLIEGIYSDMKRSESRSLAEAVQSELARALHDTNPSSTPRAVKTAPFAVLVGANMPAILTEVACLSNPEEAQLLASPVYRQLIAQALFSGIRSYINTLEQKSVVRKEAPS